MYGRSIPSIADQLFGGNKEMSDEDKIKKAQKIYDSIMTAFPGLKNLINYSQNFAKKHGYVETILGRRRHLPDMQLDEFTFSAMPGYVNPYVDPLDVNAKEDSSKLPQSVIDSLTKEFKSYKYYGQIARRIKELQADKIKVTNNRPKIQDASRQCVNCVDESTEILTEDGWKNYQEIQEGMNILAFDMNSQTIVKDHIQNVHIYEGERDVISFKSSTFDALTTSEHRWVVCQSGQHARFKTTKNILNNKWPDYPILRIADNEFIDNTEYSDDMLRLIGWILTDGSYSRPYYGMHLYQSTRKPKNSKIYAHMLKVLDNLEVPYTDHLRGDSYHEIYLCKCDTTLRVLKEFPERVLTSEFIQSLSQRQANIVMRSMIEGDGTLGDTGDSITYTCESKEQCDRFQHLCVVAGHASNVSITRSEDANRWVNNKMYDSLSNARPVHVTKDYYTVTILRIKRAHIYPKHKSKETVNLVWCVTTGTGTWIARRNGCVYITGNSRVQGSAADLTKMAVLMIEHNQRWKEIGGRILTPVHDELMCEVPERYYQEGEEILSSLMSKAGDFLPFPINCDVETTKRWYGMSFPCKYPKPKSLDNMSQDEIKWVQYYLLESEYLLPVYKDENGDKPRGDAAKGCNGIYSEDMQSCINDYIEHFHIDRDSFLDHIEYTVSYGSLPNSKY